MPLIGCQLCSVLPPCVGYKLAFNYLKVKRLVDAIDVCHQVSAVALLLLVIIFLNSRVTQHSLTADRQPTRNTAREKRRMSENILCTVGFGFHGDGEVGTG